MNTVFSHIHRTLKKQTVFQCNFSELVNSYPNAGRQAGKKEGRKKGRKEELKKGKERKGREKSRNI